MRTFLRILVWSIAGLFIALLLLPFALKTKFQEEVKNYAEQNFNAEFDFTELNLSLLRSFPDVQLTLNNVYLVGLEEFEGQNLISSKKLILDVDLLSLFGEREIEINEFSLESPKVNLLRTAKGITNYDIIKSPTNQEQQAATININSYRIVEGDISYRDLSSDINLNMIDVNHSGKGRYKENDLYLNTSSNIGALDLELNRINYLNKAKLEGPLNLIYEITENKLTIDRSDLKLNNLKLSPKGEFVFEEESVIMDFDLSAPSNSFKEVYSIIPYAFKKDLDRMELSGDGSLSLKLKGAYSKNEYPNIDFKIYTNNGSLFDKKSAEKLENIDLDLRVKAGNTDWSDLSIYLDKANYMYAGKSFKSSGEFKNIFSDYYLDIKTKGGIDLSIMNKFFLVQKINKLKGLGDVDLSLNASKEAIESNAFSAIDLQGYIKLNDVYAQYDSIYELSFSSLLGELDANNLKLNIEGGSIGESDYKLEASILNPHSYFGNQALNGNLKLVSGQLNIDELLTLLSQEKDTISKELNTDYQNLLDRLNLDLEATIDRLIYDANSYTDVNYLGALKADAIYIQAAELEFYDSPFNFSGRLDNIHNYTFQNEPIKGNLVLSSKGFDYNKYDQVKSTDNSDSDHIKLPKNIDVEIQANFESIHYGNYRFDNSISTLSIRDEQINFNNTNLKLDNADVKLNGFYNSKSKDPILNVDMDLNNVRFKNLFKYSPSFQKLSPFAEFIEGTFNSTLKLDGPLNEELLPVLSKITAEGYLETIDARIEGLKPLNELGDKLGINSLKNLVIKNTKNWFEIVDGFVILMPQLYEYKGMKLTVGGSHHINQIIDYTIKAVIPRALVKDDKIGGKAEEGISFLEKEAKKRGVNIDLGEMVYMDVFITGTLLDPILKIVPTGSGGEKIDDLIEEKIEEKTTELKDTVEKEIKIRIDKAKDSLSDKTNEVLDTLSNKMQEEMDQVMDDLKEKAKGQMDSTLNSQIDTLIGKSGELIKDGFYGANNNR